MKTPTSSTLGKPNKKGYKKYIIAVVVLLLVVVFFILHSAKGAASAILQTAPVAMGNVVESVSVTGNVLPVDKADLSFEKSGVVTAIDVKVGDTVMQNQPIASLDSATDQASLASAQAKLDDMTRGLRPVESAADQSSVNTAQVSLTNAQTGAINAFNQGYVQAQSSVNNYSDTLFNNPQSSNPTLNILTSSQQQTASLDQERLQVSGSLAAWKADIAAETSTSTLSVDASTQLLTRAVGYLSVIQKMMSDLSSAVNNLNTQNSNLSQNTINADVTTINSALGGINQSVTTVTSAQTTLTNASSSLSAANDQFALDQAGSSQDSIDAQAAQVALAKAELAQDTITAPLAGTITQVVPSVGEFVPAGQVQFSVIDPNQYEIEAYVAEADIAKVAIGNEAAVTLDAYGSDVNFPAHVVDIDPAETVQDGVPTYKVTLYFDQPDTRIRSGMTANTVILTHQADNVLNIPYRAVTTGNGSSTVMVLRVDGKHYDVVPVTTGLKGSDGTIEIDSGLSSGQTVVVDLKQ